MGMSAGILRIENEIILHGRRDNRAWFEPGICIRPSGDSSRLPEVFVVGKLLTGNDIGPLIFTRTKNLGKTWTPAALSRNWHKVPMQDDVFEEPWLVPMYHRKTGKLVALGNTHFVRDEGGNTQQKNEKHVHLCGHYGSSVYSLWNEDLQDFEPWRRIEIPGDFRLGIYYAGQKHECSDGTLLAPGYYYSGPDKKGSEQHKCITVLRLSFDGSKFELMEHGSVHVVEEARGLAEPSIVRFGGEFFMTVRHDFRGYVTRSNDGLNFDELIPWIFDDGAELGNHNTQQRWLKHGDRLYLVYNRKSELSGGVFRDRAPLFMAEVDATRLCVIRESERIVFPEKGARTGNFCIADVSPAESWIITGEWLEGMFSDSSPEDRFYIESPSINFIRYIGDLLLARVIWKD